MAEILSILLDFSKARYKEEMNRLTVSPNHIEEPTLKKHHATSSNRALQLISETHKKSLAEEQKQKIKESLDFLFNHYQDINQTKKERPGPAIGIDLGTTYCCVAVFRNDRDPEIIQNDVGKDLTPSYVGFQRYVEAYDSDDSETNDVVFGTIAKDIGVTNPKGTIYDVKRMFGRKFNDPKIQHCRTFWPFDIIDEGGEIKVKTGPASSLYPIEISAELLKYLKQSADDLLDFNVVSAVVAVPAYFNYHQRELTRQACVQAGLNVLQLISEPTAAAIAYSIHKMPKLGAEGNNQQQNCLIFDFGGGTFDLAFLTVNNNQIFVKAVGGDDHLGGENIDNNMMDYCIQKFKDMHGIDVLKNRLNSNPIEAVKISTRLRRLKLECEKHKIYLSKINSTTVTLEAFHEDILLAVPISRETFNSINSGVFEKCISVLEGFLRKENIERECIDEIVLVGGSTRIPKIQEMLSTFFNDKKLCHTVDPDKAVAIGASMLAYYAEHVEVPNILVPEQGSFDEKSANEGATGSAASGSEAASREIRKVQTETATVKAKGSQNSNSKSAGSVKNLVSRFEQKASTAPTPQPQWVQVNAAYKTVSATPPPPIEYTSPSSELTENFVTVKKPDIGIYIDSQVLRIGSYEQTQAERWRGEASFKPILSMSPEVYFSDGGILIGEAASGNKDAKNERYFDICKLINSPSTKIHRFAIKGTSYALCTSHVIAAYFLKTFDTIKMTGDGKIVVALPFKITFTVVEKIRKALNILGYFDVRILPTLATIGVASMTELWYYKGFELATKRAFRKHLFVIDVKRDSFSMGVLSVLPEGISAISASRSDNVGECLKDNFVELHTAWYDGKDIPSSKKGKIKDIYKGCIAPFFSISLNLYVNTKIDAIVLSQSRASAGMLEMIKGIIRSQVGYKNAVIILGDPLQGASLFVASNSGSVRGILPQNLQIDVTGMYNKSLTLTSNIENNQKYKNFTSRTFNIPKSSISTSNRLSGEFFILLHDVYTIGSSTVELEAGQYQLTLESKSRKGIFTKVVNWALGKVVSIEIRSKQDLDGFYSLSVAHKSDVPFTVTLAKKDHVICNTVCVSPVSSEFGRLLEFYKERRN